MAKDRPVPLAHRESTVTNMGSSVEKRLHQVIQVFLMLEAGGEHGTLVEYLSSSEEYMGEGP